MGDKYKPEWRVIGASVTGASHERVGLPNQDAIRWVPETGTGLPLILAVSDGHGSAKCFRSDLGAQFAVEVATTEMEHVLSGQPDVTNLSAIKRAVEERLPQALVRAWKERVEEHTRNIPFSPEELDGLEKKDGTAARQAVEANPLLAYGATLLSVLVTELFIIYLQLGDGDILTVSAGSEVARPLPEDERLIANETTSLCSSNAWGDFRTRFQPLSVSSPVLILLSTDGYANSFQDSRGFLKVGSDLLEMIRSEGLDKVQEKLKIWLAEASQTGSGDDITLGVLKRSEETEIDSILRRVKVCEDELESKVDRSQADGQARRLDNFERALQDMTKQNKQILARVSKLQWGLIIAAFLAVSGIVVGLVARLQRDDFTSSKRQGVVAPSTLKGFSTSPERERTMGEKADE